MALGPVSIVVSVYNEAAALPSFWTSLRQELLALKAHRFEVVWVNDGSVDASAAIISGFVRSATDTNIRHRLLDFSRNFGHEAAMIAGIDHAGGDVVICMDADGQHPPTQIPVMLKAVAEGAEVVLMERIQRADNGFIKNMASRLFYNTLNRLSIFRFQENSTDFFLITRPVMDVLRGSFRERTRFIRGFIQSLGFQRAVLPFDAPARQHGSSNYSFGKLFKLGVDAVFAFSNKPLRLAVFFSLGFVLLSMFFIGYSLSQFITTSTVPSGYTTIVIFLSVSFSLLFITLTVFALYFEKMIHETRRRPIYIVRRSEGPAPW